MAIGTALFLIAIIWFAIVYPGFRKLLLAGAAIALVASAIFMAADRVSDKDEVRKKDAIDVEASKGSGLVTDPELLKRLHSLPTGCQEANDSPDGMVCTKYDLSKVSDQKLRELYVESIEREHPQEYVSVDRTCAAGYEEVPAVGLPPGFIPDQARCKLKH
jgi:hypothetical protein